MAYLVTWRERKMLTGTGRSELLDLQGLLVTRVPATILTLCRHPAAMTSKAGILDKIGVA